MGMNNNPRHAPAIAALSIVSIILSEDNLPPSKFGIMLPVAHPIAHRLANTIQPTTISAIAAWKVAAPNITRHPLEDSPDRQPILLQSDPIASPGFPLK